MGDEVLILTKGTIGLDNVTNDAQLKRSSGDIATFSEKVSPVVGDIILIEDSEDSNNKKKIQIDNLPAATPASHASSHQDGGGDEVQITGWTSGAGIVANGDSIQEAIEKVNGNEVAHEADVSNPHSVTKTQVGLSNVSNILNNYAASSIPTADDDSDDGYSVGSTWWYVNAKKTFICLDASVGSAVWSELFSDSRVRNNTGALISRGSVVYVNGASGNLPTIAKAQANTEDTSKGVVGFVLDDIDNNGVGYIVPNGSIFRVNTSGITAGNKIYLSADTAGAFVDVAPVTPAHLTCLGTVLYEHANQGIILIDIINGFELDELHDVLIASPISGNYLKYTGSYWENAVFNTDVSANSDVSANTTHRTSNGSDHTYIDQSVTSGSSPTFDGVNFTGIPDTGVTVHGSTETLGSYLDDITINGFLDETTLTDAGGLNISWVAGNSAFINGSIIDMTTVGSPYTLTDNATNYMYATIAGGTTFIVSTTPPTGEFATRARVYTQGGDIIKIVEEPLIRNVSTANHENLEDLHSEIVVSGLILAVDADGTNANDFTVSTGVFYISSQDRETNDALFYSAGSGHAENLIERYYHSSSTWTEENSNGVDFDFWDNGTNKTAVNNVKWYSASLFWEPNGFNRVDYVYPQTEHDSEADAVAEALTYPPYHQGAVVPIGKFVFRGIASAFGATAYFIDKRPLHGGGSGSGTNQNVFVTHTADTGSTTADSANDTLTHTGGTGITTSISGDILTISGDAASTTTAGVVELAIASEINTGTDATRAVSPDALAGSVFGEVGLQATIFNYTTDVVTGDGKFYLHIDDKLNGMDLVRAHAEVITAGTTGTTDIQIYNVTQAADMLTTKLTIDTGETGSDTAATPAVIDTSNDDVATNDLLRIDVDAVSTTAPKGLIVTLIFRLP